MRVEAFWTTVATVIPVLALAVVLEIRAYGVRWLDQPVWGRTLQAASWIAFFIGATVAMLGVLRALRHDPAHPEPPWLADLSVNVIALGTGVLILAPAVELVVRVLIPFFAFLPSSHPKTAFKAWSLYLRARASRKTYLLLRGRALELADRGEQILLEKEAQLRENSEGIRAARKVLSGPAGDDPRRSEAEKYLEDAEVWERRTESYVAEGRQILSSRPPDADDQFDRTVADAKKLVDELKTFSLEDRRDFERLLQSVPWGLNPLITLPPPEPPPRPAVYNGRPRPRSRALGQQRARLRSSSFPKQRARGDSGYKSTQASDDST